MSVCDGRVAAQNDRFNGWAIGPPFLVSEAGFAGNGCGMEVAQRIAEIVGPSLAAMGYDLVRVHMVGGGARATVQIMVERADEAAMTVDDCAVVSKTVSALLDVDDPVPSAYMLEVSSPGLDRPLTRPRDYARFAGFEAKLELQAPRDGRRRFRGRILGIADGIVRLATEDGEAALPFEAIGSAKLVLTDDLLAAAKRPAARA